MPKKTDKAKKGTTAAADANTEKTKVKQSSRTRGLIPFKPGQSGNPAGRPKGSRNALCARYIEDLKTVWEETGIKTIREAAKENPVAFARLVGALVPTEWDMGDKTQDAFREFLAAARNAGPANPHKGERE